MIRIILFTGLFFAFSAVFAQEEAKIVVYVTGELGANEKEALGTKMLSSFTQSGKYYAIENAGGFFSSLQEHEKSKALDNSQIIAFGKQFGAQFVCLVNIKPAFDSYHVSASIIDTETSKVVIMGEAGSALKSLDDLTNVTNELSVQLLQLQATTPVATPATVTQVAVTLAATEPQTCDKKYNINELLAQIQYGFPSLLNDCGSSLAKAIAMSKVPFSKTPAPEPKSYMTSCTMDGIKGRLPDGFPGLDKAIDDTQKFLQTVLNTALAGGPPNPASLMKAASDIDGLLNSIKSLKNGACIVDEPYEYVEPVKETPESGGGDLGGEKEDKFFTFGFRFGINLSHVYMDGGTYESTMGLQTGLAFDFAVSEVFHLQPGIMYVQKGMEDTRPINDVVYTYHYLEIPLLISLKFSAFRFNIGPYVDLSFSDSAVPYSPSDTYDKNDGFYNSDIGINTGLGFDIDWFYIGLFYDYGLADIHNGRYNRTFGLNLGVNL